MSQVKGSGASQGTTMSKYILIWETCVKSSQHSPSNFWSQCLGSSIQVTVAGNHAGRAKSQHPRMDRLCSSGTFSTHCRTTQMSYKILKPITWTWPIYPYKKAPCTLKKNKIKMHVNIASKSPEEPLSLVISSFESSAVLLVRFSWRYQSVFLLLIEFTVWGRLCVWACGFIGRNSIIRRLMICK